MRILHRPFDEQTQDFAKMWQFLIRDYRDKQEQFIWSLGRLGDWKYGIWNEQKYIPNFMRKNAQLWFNSFGELIGFVLSEDCDSRFNVFAARGYEFLYPEMLRWIKTHWGGREGDLCTEVHEYQHSFIDALQQEGFEQTELACITRQYRVAKKSQEPICLGERFVIQDMASKPDLHGKSQLYANVWGHKEEASPLDIMRDEYNRENPCFYPRLDLSIVDEKGLHVAACMAFIDYDNSYAEIEKVCSHSDYRGKGLAEAVIRKCFQRLHEEGIQYAYITGYSEIAKNLYGKLGAEKSKNWYTYVLAKK